MTIKQYGGVFGRNPTFNNVTVDGTLTVDQIVEKTGAAGITLDGVTLKDGNVVLANGKGIDFSATSGTGTSELFDDYEEGTWTVTDQSAAGLTFTNPTGHYVKVGRFVSAFAAFTFPTTLDINNASIGGLPYSALDDNSARATGVITYSNYAATHSLWIYGPRNSGQFLIIDSAANAKTNANLSGKTFYVQFNYQT